MKLYELLANLLIVLLSAMSAMRGLEFIIRGEKALQNASQLYIKLSQYIDIQSMGWGLLVGSLILLASVFTKGNTAFVFMIIGGGTLSLIFLFHGMVAVDSAKVISTYYTSLTLSIYQFIIFGIGVYGLWKTHKKKDT